MKETVVAGIVSCVAVFVLELVLMSDVFHFNTSLLHSLHWVESSQTCSQENGKGCGGGRTLASGQGSFVQRNYVCVLLHAWDCLTA